MFFGWIPAVYFWIWYVFLFCIWPDMSVTAWVSGRYVVPWVWMSYFIGGFVCFFGGGKLTANVFLGRSLLFVWLFLGADVSR